MEPKEIQEWVTVAPGVEVCIRPGDSKPTEADVVAARLWMRLAFERALLRSQES